MRTDALVSPARQPRWLAVLLMIFALAPAASAQNRQDVVTPGTLTPSTLTGAPVSAPAATTQPAGPLGAAMQLPDFTKRETFSAAMQLVVVLTVLSLAPAILIMMTCFTRIVIVLSLLRQALGTQQLPPNQVLIGLALFMTFLVMRPTWERVNSEALRPYMDGSLSQQDALENAKAPVRDFMIRQITHAKNDQDVLLFADFANQKPQTWGEVTMIQLIPGYILSELKIAFLMGFQVYLPFLVIDMVISTVLISMGMMMLPPALISLPFKLLLFVLVDGWRLITSSLMGTFF
jgi:flagellar biosynthetic protein FliP